jgi:hypothetical protein
MTISLPSDRVVSDSDARRRQNESQTFFHVTSVERAHNIIASNQIVPGAEGHVFAWGLLPNEAAIRTSGAAAASGNYVVLMFQTNAAFQSDLSLPQTYRPIMAMNPGVVNVSNVMVVNFSQLTGPTVIILPNDNRDNNRR